MTVGVGSEIMVGGGYAQFLHGVVTAIDTSFSEPFVTFAERRSRGRVAKTAAHLVPMRYCAAFDLSRPNDRGRND